jgi:homogentisate 1,2-dioxygenase
MTTASRKSSCDTWKVGSDEVLFCSDNDFMSRAGLASASGLIHGTQPAAVGAASLKERTSELAVMLDTFATLGLGEAARGISDPDYPWSWSGGRST